VPLTYVAQDAVDQAMELAEIPCMAYKGLNGENNNGICGTFRYVWKFTHRSLIVHILNSVEIKKSVEFLVDTLLWYTFQY
jgi:hypothetical protein